MQRFALFLTILFFMPVPGTAEEVLPAGYCRDRRAHDAIRNILAVAVRENLSSVRMVNRINMGRLKRIPCPRILSALRIELALQRDCARYLRRQGLTGVDLLALSADLRSLGIDRMTLSALLAAYRARPGLVYLGRAGHLLLRMRGYGWSYRDTLPVARAVMAGRLSPSRITLGIRLLQYGGELSVPRHVVSGIVAGGLLRGETRRRMEQSLREHRPF